MPKRAAALAPDAEVIAALHRAIGLAKEPVAASKLRTGLKGSLKRSEEQVLALLEAERAAGRLFRYAPRLGKSPCYWDRDPPSYARQLVLAAVQKKPQALKDLEKSAGKRLKDYSTAQWKELLDGLVCEGKLYLVPGASAKAAMRYSVAPADPRDYLKAAVSQWRKKLDAIAGQLESCGVPPTAVVSAAVEMLAGTAVVAGKPAIVRAAVPGGTAIRTTSPPTPDFAARFDAAFDQLDRQRGSHNFVSLVDLRRALDDCTRDEFNAGLQQLRLDGRYELSGAESLGGLRPEDREAGIQEAGNLLLYVSRRDR